MLSFLLSILGVGKTALSWLSHRSLIEVACIALMCIVAVQHFTHIADKRHAHKVEAQLVKCSEARKADSTAKNEQKAETTTRIETVRQNIGVADGKAQVIEQAPLRGECRTPDAIMGADL